MTTTQTTLNMLKAAVSARKDSLAELRSRIEALISEIPMGTRLADDAGEIGQIRAICTGASQWANREWDVTLRGKGLISDGKLISETCDRSYFDGRNMHHHKTEAFCLGNEEGPVLAWASGKDTRAIAVRLPRAIERYMEACAAETAAINATIATVNATIATV